MVKSPKATYLDNGFYQISSQMATTLGRQPCGPRMSEIMGAVPKWGYERRVQLTDKQAEGLFGDRYSKIWWLSRTCHKRKWVWSLHK